MTSCHRRVAYVLVLVALTLAAAEGLLRAWHPAPTRHYVWPPNLRVDFAPTDAATPGVTGRGRFRTNSLGLRSDEPFADAGRIVYVLGGSTAAARSRQAMPGNWHASRRTSLKARMPSASARGEK